MNKSQLENLYKISCQGKGFQPNAGQFKIWQLTLGHLEEVDLAAALVRYFETETAFPMPAELKTLAASVRRERLTGSAAPTFSTRFECPVCGHAESCWLPKGEIQTRTCRSVYGPMRKPGQRYNVLDAILPPGETCGAIMEHYQADGPVLPPRSAEIHV